MGVGDAFGADVIKMNGRGACSGTDAAADAPHAVNTNARRAVRKVLKIGFMNVGCTLELPKAEGTPSGWRFGWVLQLDLAEWWACWFRLA